MTDLTYTLRNVDDYPRTCKKCSQGIREGHAYELGDDRWHIHCFKCSKCDTSLGCNSNFLVLGNGNLICSNCSYNCKQCNKKIDDLAILTGDQSYCSNCFKCRSCKRKIEDLRYARTSRGLFCMSCHEKLVSKKRSHDLRKKKLAELREKEAREKEYLSTRSSNNNNIASNPLNGLSRSNSSLASRSKNLPEAPLARSSSASSTHNNFEGATSSLVSESNSDGTLESSRANQSSYSSLGKDSNFGGSDYPDDNAANDLTIVEVSNSDEEVTHKNQHEENIDDSKVLQSGQTPVRSEYSDSVSSQPHGKDNGSLFLDIINIPPSPPKEELKSPAHFKTPNIEYSSVFEDNSSEQNSGAKNLLILSPGQFNDHEFHRHSPNSNSERHDQSSTLAAPVSEKGRYAHSPSAKANRQARVVEADYLPSHQENADRFPSFSPSNTPKRGTPDNAISSPPPKVPLPSVPSTPKKNLEMTPESRDSLRPRPDNTPRGLGLEGIPYDEKENYETRVDGIAKTVKPFGENTPTVTNLEDSNELDSSSAKKKASLGRKMSLKHKRSISGGTGGISSKLGFFKSSGNKNEDAGSLKGHSRHVSEGSVSGGSAFTTPPLPSTTQSYQSSVFRSGSSYREHYRASSDTPFLTSFDHHDDIKSRSRAEIELEKRSRIVNENKQLELEKKRLNEDLKSIRSQISLESQKLDSIMMKVESMEQRSKSLHDSNLILTEQNQQMENALKRLGGQTGEALGNTSASSLINTETGSGTEKGQSTLSGSLSNNHSNSSTSSIVAQQGSEHDDLHGEAQKATRLKFWRRPKLGFNSPNINTSPNLQPSNVPNHAQVSNQHLSSSRSNQQYNARNISSPQKQYTATILQPDDKKGSSSVVTKSKSSYILDSFLSSGNNGSSGSLENAPLFDSTIQKRADFENEEVPLIISRCILEVEKRGLDVEGLYRISGGNSAIVAVETSFASLPQHPLTDERSMARLNETLESVDINAITSALKRYFRKLPDPIIPYSLYEDYIRVGSRLSHNQLEQRIDALRHNIIEKLSPASKKSLFILCKHLSIVNDNSSLTRMGYKNLSMVFAPTLARSKDSQREITDTGYRNDSTEVLLQHWKAIFKDYR